VNGEVIVGSVADRGNDIRQRPRTNYTRWPKLVDAPITCVELREDIVAADIALQQTAKIFLDSLLFWIHRYIVAR
jgi:hypothetical protein